MGRQVIIGMAMLSPIRKFLKVFHPEGIPWPCTVLYNSISRSRIFQRHYDLVVEDIRSYCPEGSILDVGTGPGWLLLRLHEKCPALQLNGLDVSPSMVARARKNMANAGLAEIIMIKEGNVEDMPLNDDSFDIVVSTGSIHHWKEPTRALNEVHRVLKPGGYGLMYDLVSDTPSSIPKEAAQKFGRLKMVLLWLHAFEEPFYSCDNFGLLARPTLFEEGRIQFVGVMCCLILKKELHASGT